MATVADVYRALNSMRDEDIVENYAVCGGTAALFYADTLRTFDIDIFVLIRQTGFLISLSSIYEWARSKGFEVKDEYLLVYGVPVQILVAGEGLESEAVKTANLLDYDGVLVPVLKPEFLVLIYTKVGGRQRVARAIDIAETVELDLTLVQDVVKRYSLQDVWKRIEKELDES